MGIILTFSLFALPLPFLSLSKYLEHESKSLSNWGRSLSGQMLVRLVDFFLTPLDANCCNDGLCVVIGAEDGCWITLLGLMEMNAGFCAFEIVGAGGGDRGGLALETGVEDEWLRDIFKGEKLRCSGRSLISSLSLLNGLGHFSPFNVGFCSLVKSGF